MLGQEVGSREAEQEREERLRVRRAGIGAVLGVPAVLAVVAVTVGQWELSGAAVLWPALLIAFVGCLAAGYARTAPLALGAMAGLVVAIGSLFRPGGVLGSIFAIGAGMAGGAIGVSAAGGEGRPRPWVSGVLGPIAVFGGVGAFVVLAALIGVAADPLAAPDTSSSLKPWAVVDACSAADLPAGPADALRVSIRKTPADGPSGVAFSVRVDAKDSYFESRGLADAGYMSYVVVHKEGSTSPVYASPAGGGRPISGMRPTSLSAGPWDGQVCGTTGQRFSTVAAPGRYVAKAVVVVGQEEWSSKPVEFDFAP